jgi:hypothetical protein
MTEQQNKSQTNNDNQVKPELSPPPKLTRTLPTSSCNIDDIPPFPPLLVRQTCEDKDFYHLKFKNDKLDKKITCDTVQEENSELPLKTLSTSSDDKPPHRIVLSSFGDTLSQKQD